MKAARACLVREIEELERMIGAGMQEVGGAMDTGDNIGECDAWDDIAKLREEVLQIRLAIAVIDRELARQEERHGLAS